jgi:drug/metabolite transporter (DMT)-like permease
MSAPSLPAPANVADLSPSAPAGTASWRRWLPAAAVLGAAACWGAQGIVYALIVDQVQTDGLTIVTLRAATATLLLWLWLGITNPAALRIPRADLPSFAALGLIAVTVFYPALFYTYAWTSVAVGPVLLYLSPALVALGAAVFLGEPLTPRKLMREASRASGWD